ncbi:MAG: hypothetical protein SFY69_10240 [Planctomycetota bacterium]|nr:hypothetical protein [Planctomycetota bacterium]
MPTRPNAVPQLLACACTLLALGGPALAQRAVPNTPPTAPAGVTGTVEFDDEAFRLDSVGLEMLLPMGSKAESGSVGGRVTATIKPEDGTWLVNITTPRTANPEVTAAHAMDEVVTQILKTSGEVYDRTKPGQVVGYRGTIIVPRSTVEINGMPAERAYVLMPPEGGSPAVVRGYTIFRLTPQQFVTFELITTEPVLAGARRESEGMIGTATFEDPAKVGNARAAAIKTGLKVFERTTPDVLREIVEAMPERWERLYRPSPTGAKADEEEVGYRRVRCALGRRGELDPTKKHTGAGDREQGFVVRMDARWLDRPNEAGAKPRIVDSQSIFFLSLDREREGWSVRNVVRDGDRVIQASELGVRDGGTMQVEVETPGQPPRTVRPVIQGEGYVSRLESLLLPQILVRAGITADMAFYVYQSDRETIRLRRDLLEQPADRPGLWRLTTRLHDQSRPQVSEYNERGALVRAELPRGTVAEPISLDELVSLWRRKGLPMD